MTKVRIDSASWVPTTRDEPNEEFPEGREWPADYWDLSIVIDGPTQSYSGGQQVSGTGINGDTPLADLVPVLKSLWGGTDDWTLLEA